MQTPSPRSHLAPSLPRLATAALFASIAGLSLASAPASLAYAQTYTTDPDGSGAVTGTGMNTDKSSCTYTVGGEIFYNEMPDYTQGGGDTWELVPYEGTYTPPAPAPPVTSSTVAVFKGSSNIGPDGLSLPMVGSKISYTTPVSTGQAYTSQSLFMGGYTLHAETYIVARDFTAFDYDYETVGPEFVVYSTSNTGTPYTASTPQL